MTARRVASLRASPDMPVHLAEHGGSPPVSLSARILRIGLASALWWAAGPGVGAEVPAGSAAQVLPATVENDNLWTLASRIDAGRTLTRQQVMVALLRRNPEAFVQGNIHRLRRGVVLVVPSAADMAAENPAKAEQLVAEHRTSIDEGRNVPALTALATTAAVTQQPAGSAAGQSVHEGASGAVGPRPTTSAAAASMPSRSASAVIADQPAVSAASQAVQEAPVDPARLPGPTGVVRLLPYLLGVLLAGGALLWWQRSRARAQFTDTVVSSFFDENGVRRHSRPRVIDISQAGVETARTVETLQLASELVRGSSSTLSAAMPLDDDPHREAAFKLEIARTQIELGRQDAARRMLEVVRREGNAAQQLAAGDLLTGLNPA